MGRKPLRISKKMGEMRRMGRMGVTGRSLMIIHQVKAGCQINRALLDGKAAHGHRDTAF